MSGKGEGFPALEERSVESTAVASGALDLERRLHRTRRMCRLVNHEAAGVVGARPLESRRRPPSPRIWRFADQLSVKGWPPPWRRRTSMIHEIYMDREPIAPGENRPIQIDSDGEVDIEFWCFRDPPGHFEVCGRIRLKPGETRSIAPSRDRFAHGMRRWRLVIRDVEDGDTQTLELPVEARGSQGTSGAMSSE